ncbi:DNA glycosylase [Cynara cardunculus var. scolymus]|uniref:DNA glycosylase n=2 Tax=Cynara cardunculus var. scolymus TaxID=59895 RepID=A0A103XKQ6_CYNCS|nr:DNA glycosylase [Cynara cardunculus var. scolymus]
MNPQVSGAGSHRHLLIQPTTAVSLPPPQYSEADKPPNRDPYLHCSEERKNPYMDEQTIQSEEPHPRLKPESSSPQSSIPSQPPRPPTDEESFTSDISQIATSNPSKIPIRPQKIRKLSSSAAIGSVMEEIKPQSTIAEADASKAIVLSTTTTAVVTKNRRRNPSRSALDLPKVIKPLSAQGEISVALRHLRSADPLLANLIDNHPPPTFDSHQAPFLALTKSILYQQLAYKAGTSIYTRFVNLCGGEDGVGPETVLSLTPQQLKQIGVSGRKASYLYDLANKYNNGILSDESVVKMDDRSLFTMLSMVKGIGSWSVHMFMIFSLHRPDVLPVSDLGVRKGVQLLYMLDELPRPSQMEQLCEKWRPYRSVGAWYMWRFVEGKGSLAAGAAAAALVSNGIIGQQQLGQSEQAQQQQQLQLQLLEPINSIGNLG